ncbi:hypothetical protein [Amycolatopsis benzoatilytica]|nr:hypothetical protein [Amycolatopsis benzoatilytica]
MPADQNDERTPTTTTQPVAKPPVPRPEGGTISPNSNHEPLDERGNVK